MTCWGLPNVTLPRRWLHNSILTPSSELEKTHKCDSDTPHAASLPVSVTWPVFTQRITQLQGQPTYTPRAVLLDLCGSLGGEHSHALWTGPLLCPLHLLLLHVSSVCTAGLNAAGEIASEDIADASTWDGPVRVQQSDRIPVSAFAEQLQYEPEQEPPERESFPAEISEVTQLLTRPPPILSSKPTHMHPFSLFMVCLCACQAKLGCGACLCAKIP